MKILFIQTGGTIDKDYPRTTKGWAFEIAEPAAKRLLEVLDPSFEYEIASACKKDSLELNDKDRQSMADLVENHDADCYILTHGTDTMLETAEYLADRFKGKSIIITGAMRPERFTNSDAAINLGTAIGAYPLPHHARYHYPIGTQKTAAQKITAKRTTTGKTVATSQANCDRNCLPCLIAKFFENTIFNNIGYIISGIFRLLGFNAFNKIFIAQTLMKSGKNYLPGIH